MFEPRSSEKVKQDIKHVQQHLHFFRLVEFRKDVFDLIVNEFVAFLNFLSKKPYLINDEVKVYLREFINKKELKNTTPKIVIERANILCDYDTLFDFDVQTINHLSQELREKEKYLKFLESEGSNDLVDPYYSADIAYRLIRYLYKCDQDLYDAYEKDKTRQDVKLIVKSSEVSRKDDSAEILLKEGVYPLSLVTALTLSIGNKNLIEFIVRNLHQDAITGLYTVCEPYLNEYTPEMHENYLNKDSEVEIRINLECPNILDIKIDFYRLSRADKNKKAFYGSYTLKVEDHNQKNEKDMRKTDVKMIDFQFRLLDENIYEIYLNNKIKSLFQKVIHKGELTQREQKDIQIILVPYLKVENNQKKLSKNPKKITNINILFLLLSQGYIREACEGLKERTLSPRENVQFKTLLNIALFSHHKHRDEFESLIKKEPAFWVLPRADKKPLNEIVKEANKPLPWWLGFAEKVMPDFFLDSFKDSFFKPIFDKKAARRELDETEFEEYLTFLNNANQEQAHEIWKETAFVNKAKVVVTSFVHIEKNMIERKRKEDIAPLCSQFLKLAYFARKNQNKGFEDLEKKASDFMKDLFLSINGAHVFNGKVTHEMDFERLDLFKKILKSDEIFSLFNRILDSGIKSPGIEKIVPGLEEKRLNLIKGVIKEYSDALLKWVETFKDPELIQLIFKRPALLELVDNETFTKIVDRARQTSTPVPQLNAILIERGMVASDAIKMKPIQINPQQQNKARNTGSIIKFPSNGVRRVFNDSSQREKFSLMRTAKNIFVSINDRNLALKNLGGIVLYGRDLERLELFKQILKSNEFFVLFNKVMGMSKRKVFPSEKSRFSLRQKTVKQYNDTLLKWIEVYKDPELIQLILKKPALVELVDNKTLLKMADIVKQTSTPIPQLYAILHARGVIADEINNKVRPVNGNFLPAELSKTENPRDQKRMTKESIKSTPYPIINVRKAGNQSEAGLKAKTQLSKIFKSSSNASFFPTRSSVSLDKLPKHTPIERVKGMTLRNTISSGSSSEE